MSYLSAPATDLVATHCCVCNRRLLHAESVERGMGPDCRARYMPAAEGAASEATAEANQIVYRLALVISGAVAPSQPGAAAARGGSSIRAELAAQCPTGATYLERLRELGFPVLASKLEDAWLRRRAARPAEPEIRVEQEGDRLWVVSPYSEAAVAASQAIPGRWWDREHRRTRYPVSQRAAVWDLLRQYYPGVAGVGPQGPFVVPARGQA